MSKAKHERDRLLKALSDLVRAEQAFTYATGLKTDDDVTRAMDNALTVLAEVLEGESL